VRIAINSKSFKDQRSFQLSKAVEILEQEEFDNAKPTVFYLHGYLETMEVESIKVIADAYLKRGDHSELFVLIDLPVTFVTSVIFSIFRHNHFGLGRFGGRKLFAGCRAKLC
jgi:hypothetical protein